MSWILTRLLNWYSLQIYSKHPRSRLYSSALKKVWVVWTWALNCVVERRQKSLARSEKVVLIKCTCASSTLSEEFSPKSRELIQFSILPRNNGKNFFPFSSYRDVFSHFAAGLRDKCARFLPPFTWWQNSRRGKWKRLEKFFFSLQSRFRLFGIYVGIGERRK